MNKPALRKDIQPMVLLVGGRRTIRFHDPYHLADDGIAVDAAMLSLLQMLDGNHDVRDIQLTLMKQQGGRMVYLSEIESFVQELDRACLLESGHFLEGLSRLKNEFASRVIREPVHAGKAYPSEPDELGRFLDAVEKELLEKQPGQERDFHGQNITGILTPHIDVHVAREAYVNAFRRLRGRRYETVVVFGVNHMPQEGLFCLSEKDYATPFGNIPTDRGFIAELRKRVPEGTIDGSDFGHRTEHSIEFQTIFLHHYLGESFSLVPILCSGIHEFLYRKENPFEDHRFMKMARAMKNLIEERKGPVLLVAGVDFSHVGHKFGDAMPADALLPRSRTFEKRMLSHIADGEPEKILEMTAENMDRFRVCGLPAILIFSTLLKRDRGELLCHETYDEKATGSAVNYASMIFTGKGQESV